MQRQPFYRRGVNAENGGAVFNGGAVTATAVSAAGEEVVRESWELLRIEFY